MRWINPARELKMYNSRIDLREIVEQRVKPVVHAVDLMVRRKRWTNEEIDAKYGQRSVVEVLADGHTCYMGPCHDLTSVALELLRKGGADPCLVLEQLVQDGFGERVHLAVEFFIGGDKFFLDFSSLNRVVFGAGDYSNTSKGVTSRGIARIPSCRFDTEAPIYKSFGFESIDPFRHILERLKRDNTPETYRGYLAKISPGQGFYVEVAGGSSQVQ